MTDAWVRVAHLIEAIEFTDLPKVPRSTDRAFLLGHLRRITSAYDRLYGAKTALVSIGGQWAVTESLGPSGQMSNALSNLSKELGKIIRELAILRARCRMAKGGRPRGTKNDEETDLWLAVRTAYIIRSAPEKSKPSEAAAIRRAISDLHDELGAKLSSTTTKEGHWRRIRRTKAAYAELIAMTPDLRAVDYTQWIMRPDQV